MTKVYVTQDLGRVNLLPAEAFGELVVVIDGQISHMGLPRALRQMRDVMRDITKDDFILPIGHPSIMTLAGYIMADITGRIRILAWDRQTEQYIKTEVQVR